MNWPEIQGNVPSPIACEYQISRKREPLFDDKNVFTGIRFQGIVIPVETMILKFIALSKRARAPRQIQVAPYLIQGAADYHSIALQLDVTDATVSNAGDAFLSRCANSLLVTQKHSEVAVGS